MVSFELKPSLLKTAADYMFSWKIVLEAGTMQRE
jgi:hypothetical protein